MNLLDKSLWTPYSECGNTAPEFLHTFVDGCVKWSDTLELSVKHEPAMGWYMRVPGWFKVEELKPYQAGRVVSKNQYLYGKFEFTCRLPSFRGAWPAIWLLGSTMPPEIDIMELFYKKCIDRYKTTHTHHDLPTEPGKYSKIIKSRAYWQAFDVTARDMTFTLNWTEGKLEWLVNGDLVQVVIKPECKEFPSKPMNLIINSGVGDWSIQNDKLTPFVIKSMSYHD